MKIGLVSCVKSKQSGSHPACELYNSPLFKYAYNYATEQYDKVYILSAKYGLVEPRRVLTGYELTLNSMNRDERLLWSYDVLGQIKKKILRTDTIYWHAGKSYNEFLSNMLLNEQVFPLKGLGIGKQLGWYKKRSQLNN